jgi:hypothetical protein
MRASVGMAALAPRTRVQIVQQANTKTLLDHRPVLTAQWGFMHLTKAQQCALHVPVAFIAHTQAFLSASPARQGRAATCKPLRPRTVKLSSASLSRLARLGSDLLQLMASH